VVESVYSAVRTNCLYKADYVSHLKGWQTGVYNPGGVFTVRYELDV
jgi:ABC-type enterochelin transport system permease subunit